MSACYDFMGNISHPYVIPHSEYHRTAPLEMVKMIL